MRAEILALLDEAPATTGEIAALIGVPSNKGPGAVLCAIRRDGLIVGRPVPNTTAQRGPRMTTMWHREAAA